MNISRISFATGSAGRWGRIIAFGLFAGLLVSLLTPALIELGRKLVVVGLLGLILFAIALALHRVREIFLFAWVVSLTYNRQFWSFNALVGDQGAFGPYWMISDLILILLVTIWMYQVIILKRPQQAYARSFLPWYAPFAIVAALSIIGAAEPVWSLGDIIRILKLGLVLMYFRYNVGPREWWLVVIGLGVAVVIQSTFGMIEVATGHTGVLWLIGLGGQDINQIVGIAKDEVFGGWTRATGTVAHPPYLAAFLILVVPIFMSLALTQARRKYRWLCIGVTLFGLIGLCCTLARLPIVLMLVQTLALFGLLILLRMASITRVIAIAACAGLVLSITGLVGADFIHERLNRDLKSSVDQRVAEYKVAMKMVEDYPVFGVGLNNYAAYMVEYGSDVGWGIKKKWQDVAMHVTHMRLLPGPLNGYLYIASVMGVAGLVAFLWLATGGLLLGWRAIRGNTGGVSAAALGMCLGMVGLYLHQVLSYTIWIDTDLSVWIVLVGLVGCAVPGLHSPTHSTIKASPDNRAALYDSPRS